MSSQPERPDDLTFERRLLESAKGDARPQQVQEVQEAWARFAGKLSIILPDPGGDFGEPGARGPAPTTVAAPVAGVHPALHTAIKWFLLGAIGGGGLTVSVMINRSHPRFDRPIAESETAPPPRGGKTTRAAAPAVSLADEPAGAPQAATERRPVKSISRHLAHQSRRAEASSRDRPQDNQHIVSAASSTLAAEVSRIDSARTASSTGDHDEALRLIELYHQDFPNGVLAPDADVVAIEAAGAKGDRVEIARRAQSFLARYPNDPHAARVRRVVERLPER